MTLFEILSCSHRPRVIQWCSKFVLSILQLCFCQLHQAWNRLDFCGLPNECQNSCPSETPGFGKVEPLLEKNFTTSMPIA